MAAVSTGKKVFFPRKIRTVLRKGLATAGIQATVETKPIPQTQLTRVAVYSPAFKHLRHSERQDLVWRIIGQCFSPDEQLHISIIMTLAPREVNVG